MENKKYKILIGLFLLLEVAVVILNHNYFSTNFRESLKPLTTDSDALGWVLSICLVPMIGLYILFLWVMLRRAKLKSIAIKFVVMGIPILILVSEIWMIIRGCIF